MGESLDTVTQTFELPLDIPEGERHNTYFKFTCSLWSQSEDEAEITRIVLDENASRSNPLPERELLDIVKDVTTRYPQGLSPEYETKRKEGKEAAKKAKTAFDGVYINDIDLSKKFGEMYHDHLRYVPEVNGWYAYSKKQGRWLTKEHGGEGIAAQLMKEFIEKLCKAVASEPIDDDDGKEKSSRMKAAGSYRSAAKRRNLLTDSKGELQASITEFDNDYNLLNVKNGTIELHPFKFREHRAADMITKQAGCDYIEGKHCPEWVSFLNETFAGRPEVIPFIQRRLAMCLSGDTSLECFYIVYGEPRTGKSTLVETVKTAMGDYSTTAEASAFKETKTRSEGATPGVAKMKGARLVDCPELPQNMHLDVAFVKRITGGDVITARFLNENQFDFRPRCTIVINTNHLPNVTDQTIFSSDRCVLIRFPNVKPKSERDGKLKDRLQTQEALSGVLTWLVDGHKFNLAHGSPSVPEVCEKDAAQYATESDRLGNFIEDCCERKQECKEPGSKLYSAYKNWCEECGYISLSRNRFFKELAQRRDIVKLENVYIGKQKHRVAFENISLLPQNKQNI